jgi:hypothetical protein
MLGGVDVDAIPTQMASPSRIRDGTPTLFYVASVNECSVRQSKGRKEVLVWEVPCPPLCFTLSYGETEVDWP